MALIQDPTHPTGVSDETPRGNSEVARARDRKANSALQLKIAGADWDQIAEIVGYPSGNAALVATERALEKELRSEESKKYMRSVAGKRLERLVRAVWKKAIDEDHPEQLRAVAESRLLIDRHSKLHGLDAPTEMVVTNPSMAEIEKWVSKMISVAQPDLEEGDVFEGEWFEDGEEPSDSEAPGGEPLALPAE